MTSAATICMTKPRAKPRMTAAIVEAGRLVGRTAVTTINDSETITVTAEMVKETDACTLPDFIHAWTEHATLVITDNAWSRIRNNRPWRVHIVGKFKGRHSVHPLDTVAQTMTYAGMTGPERIRRLA